MKKLFFLLLLLILAYAPSYGQKNSNVIKGNKMASKGLYLEAAAQYKSALLKDSTNFVANLELGKLYLYDLERFDSAYFFLKRAANHEKAEQNFYLFYEYGIALRLNGFQTKSIEMIDKFDQMYQDKIGERNTHLDSLMNMHKRFANNDLIFSAEKHKDTTELLNLGTAINTYFSEYTSVFFENDSALIYNGRYKDSENEKAFMDDQFMESMYLYNLPFKSTELYAKDVNHDAHTAIVSEYNNSSELVVYYHNTLWKSASVTNKKLNLVELPLDIYDFLVVPHGVFSADQKLFVFSAKNSVSEDLDLYYCLNNSGSWTKPKPVEAANSNLNEDAPFIGSNNELYFSSKGHGSSGGYDIFKLEWDGKEWKNIEQLPRPFNSPADDIFFILGEDQSSGFLSSNRVGGFGQMDIYSFGPKKQEDIDTTDLIVQVNESIDTTSNINNTNQDISLNTLEDKLDTVTDTEETNIGDASSDSDDLNENSTDLGASENNSDASIKNFEPILFNTESYTLTSASKDQLDKIIEYMKSNPELSISISGYSDNSGDSEYNKWLSQKRAETSRDYILSKGIAQNRILNTTGYGEKNPAKPNKSDSGKDLPENRKLNRRVEFTFSKQ